MAKYKVIELRDCEPITHYYGGSEKKAYQVYERLSVSPNPVEMLYIEQQARNPAMENMIFGIEE